MPEKGDGDAAVSANTLAKCAEIMNVSFPEGTVALNYRALPGMDHAILLKIRVPIDDVESFLARSPFAGRPLRSDRRFPPPFAEASWWTVEEPERFQSGQAALPRAAFLDILIDLDDAEVATIYLHWSET